MSNIPKPDHLKNINGTDGFDYTKPIEEFELAIEIPDYSQTASGISPEKRLGILAGRAARHYSVDIAPDFARNVIEATKDVRYSIVAAKAIGKATDVIESMIDDEVAHQNSQKFQTDPISESEYWSILTTDPTYHE